MYDFAVFGGDLRQWYLAELLAGEGYRVCAYALCKGGGDAGVTQMRSFRELLMQADTIVGPAPFLRQGRISGNAAAEDLTFLELQEYLREGATLIAGNIPKSVVTVLEEEKIRVKDVLKDEYTAAKNAVATAEGVIAEAIIRSPKNLRGSQCLVIGYGRCGRIIAAYLKNLSCHVSVYETEQRRAAQAYGMADGVYVRQPETAVKDADIIINTAPCLALDQALLAYVKQDALILDIASAPGGTDFETAAKMGIRAALLPGLPGRYAPQTSAAILAEQILEEKS